MKPILTAIGFLASAVKIKQPSVLSIHEDCELSATQTKFKCEKYN